MAFGDFLAKRMKKSLEKKINKQTLTEDDIQDTLREIRLALLEADVSPEVVKELVSKIKEKATGEFIQDGVNANQQMIKIVHDELMDVLGNTKKDLDLSTKPSVIMMVGLQGSGKTTSANKLAYLLTQKQNKKVLLVGLDIYRPGAIEQLKELGEKSGIEVFEKGKQDPVKTAKQAVEYADENGFDTVILDTAGRLQIDKKLMKELDDIRKATNPNEILLVVDGMVGQEIINVTNEFNKQLKLTGVIVTKLDGDARGGATLSISYMTKLPIKFIGEGEGMKALAPFYPKRMADRLLGLGDIDTLFEKAMESVDERSMKKTMKRMFMGQYDLEDLKNQMAQVARMGSMGGLMKMMPGLSGKIDPQQIEDAQRKMAVFTVLMDSMTLKERREPKVLKAPKRQARITYGSGRSQKELNELLNNFDKGKKQVMKLTQEMKKGKMGNIFANLPFGK